MIGLIDNTKKDNILFAKSKKNAVIPTKRDEDGCYDIYACIDDVMLIPPHTVKLIPTGIHTAFSSKYRISVRERGSNTKFATVRAGQIDSGYRGEIFVALHNPSEHYVTITNDLDVKELTIDHFTDGKGDIYKNIIYPSSKAIAQLAVEFVPDVETKEISLEELQAIPSERGFGKLGSSNK